MAIKKNLKFEIEIFILIYSLKGLIRKWKGNILSLKFVHIMHKHPIAAFDALSCSTGYILEATKKSLSESVVDAQGFLLPLCEILETIFRKGLNHTVHSAFGLTRRDYWSWIEKTAQISTRYVDLYSMHINV